jgi:hypothetical protein
LHGKRVLIADPSAPPTAPKKPSCTPRKTVGGATATGQTGEAIATQPGGKQTLRVTAAIGRAARTADGAGRGSTDIYEP